MCHIFPALPAPPFPEEHLPEDTIRPYQVPGTIPGAGAWDEDPRRDDLRQDPDPDTVDIFKVNNTIGTFSEITPKKNSSFKSPPICSR